MRKGAINLATMITLGGIFISGLVATVTEMVTTRSIAVSAASDSKQALTETQSNKEQIASLNTNVEWIKNALKDNGVKPRYEIIITSSTMQKNANN